MHKTTKRLAVAVALASGVVSGAAQAELSANIGVVSNYVFRGYTYSDEKAALQGGIDYAHDSGLYLSAWASTIDNGVDNGVEIDYYIGFAGEAGELGYDLGYAIYSTNDKNKFGENFRELYLTGSYGVFSAGVYRGDQESVVDSEYTYVEAGLEFSEGMPLETTLALHYGVTSYDAGGPDVNDYSIGLGKELAGFDVSVNYAGQDDTNDSYAWLAVTREF